MDAFLGLAILGGVCSRRINSNVNGDTGLQTASTISHETPLDKAFWNWWIVRKLNLVMRKDQLYFAFSTIMYMY